MYVSKWSPIIEMAPIEEKHTKKVSDFCDRVAKIESEAALSKAESSEHSTLLPQNLKILAQLDLDKINLIDKSDYEFNNLENLRFSIDITHEQIQTLTHTIGRDAVEDLVNAKIIEAISSFYIDKIKENKKIFIYLPLQSIQLIAEGTKAPVLYIISRGYIKN